MNRFQKIVLFGAVLDLLLLLLFPPYDVVAFGRGTPMFDAFYPTFSVPPNRLINGDLLYILAFCVLINAALAWLLMIGTKSAPGEPRIAPQTVVIAFGMLNLVLALLFPPMEAFPFAQRITVGTFDGFYFAFGDKSRRAIFLPLLYMEVLFILVNACAFWLAMSVAQRSGAPEPEAGKPLAQPAAASPVFKRGPDRRKAQDPNYKGPERRRSSRR